MRGTARGAVCVLLVFAILLPGCAGREANPIAIYMPGDENRSCVALHAEMANLQSDIQRILPKTNKGVSNTLWAAAGVLFIVPFFFMDLKDAEKIEFDAMRQRYNRLLVYAAEKNCDLTGLQQERIPSVDEMKTMAKDQQENQDDSKQLKSCLNCSEKIGALEKVHIFEDHEVCASCYHKLKEQAMQANK